MGMLLEQKKLQQRILKSFDQLSKGKHHHFNIRQNISQGFNKKDNQLNTNFVERYNFKLIEDKWQKSWVKKKSFKKENYSNANKKNWKIIQFLLYGTCYY